MRQLAVCLVLPCFFVTACALAGELRQNDWSTGGGVAGPVSGVVSGFASSSDVSWLAIPGQVALASGVLDEPVKHAIAEGHEGAYGLYAADMDRDGAVDVIGTTDSSAEVIIWFNSGDSPPSWSAEVVDSSYPGGTAVHPADVDGDGDLDLVGAAQSPGQNVSWWRNDGGEPRVWTRITIDQVVPVACNVFAGDVDADGDIDVMSTSWSLRSVIWWRNDGGTPITWTKQVIDATQGGAHSTFAADLDGDRDLDLVATAASANHVVVYRNLGGDPVVWEPQVLGESLVGVRYASAGDIDGDGRADISAAAFDGQVVWWRNLGGEPLGWQAEVIDTTCSGGHYVWICDIDGDNRRDLLVAAYQVSSIRWYRNTSSGWQTVVVDDHFEGALTAVPGDVDGDGDLDVIGSAWSAGEVAWWEVTSFVHAGELESSVLDLGLSSLANASLVWNAAQPPLTELRVRVRSSDVAGALGAWSDPISSPGSLDRRIDRYFQYRLELETADPTVSSVLEEIALEWDFRDATPLARDAVD